MARRDRSNASAPLTRYFARRPPASVSSPFRDLLPPEFLEKQDAPRWQRWFGGDPHTLFWAVDDRREELRRFKDGPAFAWLTGTQRDRAFAAVGGDNKVDAALRALTRKAGWDTFDLWCWYARAAKLDAKGEHSQIRKHQERDLEHAKRHLLRLDKLGVPHSVLAPLERFLLAVQLQHAESFGPGAGKPTRMTNRLRSHLKSCGLKDREIARVELGWGPTSPEPLSQAEFDERVRQIKECSKTPIRNQEMKKLRLL